MIETIKISKNPEISIRYAKSANFEKASKVLFVLNGRSEWIEKFFDFVNSLNLSEDIGWATWDHRGQGLSEGKKSHIDSYNTFAEDTAVLVKRLSSKRPYSLLCHSMGGLIASYTVLKKMIKPEQLFLMSPLLGLPREPLPHFIGRPVGLLVSAIGLGGVNLGFDKHLGTPFEKNKLTNSREKFAKIMDYPYKWSGPTFDWINATFDATQYIFEPESLKNLESDTHVLVGSQEKVVDPLAFDAWVDAAKNHSKASVNLNRIEGAKHELHMEDAKYYDAASQYIRDHLNFG